MQPRRVRVLNASSREKTTFTGAPDLVSQRNGHGLGLQAPFPPKLPPTYPVITLTLDWGMASAWAISLRAR